jgi:hypothetical protein
MGAYGHDITAGMLVFDREDFTAYRPGPEPVWLVEKVAGGEERYPVGGTTVNSTYAHVRNAEVHGRDTAPSNSGWTGTKPVGRLVEAAAEDDHTKPGTFRMDRAMVAFLRATRFRGSTSDDYPHRARPGERRPLRPARVPGGRARSPRTACATSSAPSRSAWATCSATWRQAA